jgi:hypothetical protein
VQKPDQTQYKYKTNVELTAKPDKGWKFVKWKGNISSTDNTAQVTMDESKEVTAVFEATKSYTLSTSVEGNGGIWVSPPLHTFHYGDLVKFSATADKGNIFIRWEGDLSGSKNPQSLRIKGNTSVKVIFKTYEEELVSSLHADLPGDSVSEVKATLGNLLPDEILLKKVIMKDQKDSIAFAENVGYKIPSSHLLSIILTSTDSVSLNDFLNYTIEWKCEYQGEEVIKKGSASADIKSSKVESKARKPTKIIHINIDFDKNK